MDQGGQLTPMPDPYDRFEMRYRRNPEAVAAVEAYFADPEDVVERKV